MPERLEVQRAIAAGPAECARRELRVAADRLHRPPHDAGAYRDKFGGDHIDDVRTAVDAYSARIGWKR